MIFILVVLQDGDPAIHTLALTCTRFWRIVREECFLKEAHFCWLNSVVNWKAFSEEHRRTYRIPYRISCCIQCKSLYKDCEGYRGCEQRGKLQGFYSDNEFAGYCSADCFYEALCN
ncbi:Histone-lysine N-methyltransferase SMYD3 [Labeo rohita]|uniref:Histone-lysine N-methyltransferase SMYD3 n=1 Tax=Labeo rohita TaxID=84645 RepID=A0ABQ8L8Z8_LABRO|nr:Histone-lysine N-methyltransferase SMYD3 [Labeo rohita]